MRALVASGALVLAAGTSSCTCGAPASGGAPSASAPSNVAPAASALPSEATSVDVQVWPPPGRYVYEGTIAGKRVVVRLRCGDECEGRYFYVGIGESLALRPALNGRLDEVANTGDRARITGRWRFSTPLAAPSVQGTWYAPDGDRTHPIELQRIEPGSGPRAFDRVFRDSGTKGECHVEGRSVELVGLADPALEDRLDEMLRPEALVGAHLVAPGAPADEMCEPDGSRCDASAKGYRILCRAFDGREGMYLEDRVTASFLDAQLLSLKRESGFDGGGAHPSDGVRGLTVDLRTGRVLDARDLFLQPEHEPEWNEVVPGFRDFPEVPTDEVVLGVGIRGGGAVSVTDADWSGWYLSRTGLELVPSVGEAMRVLRHDVQHAPFTRIRPSLRRDGPASHLYTR